MRGLTLRRFNTFLSLVAIGLSLYVLLMPFWPQAAYRWQKPPPLVEAIEKSEPETIPQQNTLVIPRMKLQQPIHEGKNSWVLSKGVWHLPKTDTPDGHSNMVLTGHRFTYGGPAVFYHMDKLRPGDDIFIYWHQQKHHYRVENVRTVPPSAREIDNPTSDPRLTLYTCAPLVTAKNRLVILARPVDATESTP